MTKEVSGSDVKAVDSSTPSPAASSKFAVASAMQVSAQSAAQLQALTKAAAEKDSKSSDSKEVKVAVDSKASASDSKIPVASVSAAEKKDGNVWYVPSATLEQFETIPNAVRRNFASVQSRAMLN